MRFSVVINTLNRAASLSQTLDSLRYQDHDDFEVVVVNGPSTDGTAELLAAWSDDIKLATCPVANLSMSRNIGIRSASGDVVAFIDDDAIPEYSWLSELEQGYQDDETVGVGGVVFDHTGMEFQFRFGTADRYGDTIVADTQVDGATLCVPGAWNYPSLLGTNSSFRRDALARVGLFDETYEYYLDETDLIVRLVDAGGVIRAVDGAPVHHHFLPSHVRNERRTVTHWYPVIKNRTYFGLRHATDHRSFVDILDAAIDSTRMRLDESAWAEQHGIVPPGSTDRARIDCDRGLAEGIRLAAERGVGPLPAERLGSSEFRRFATRDHAGRRRIALVTSSYPPRSMAGISRFMSEVAPTLAAAGHDVRVITRAEAHPSVEWQDGVWIHRIAPTHGGLVGGSFDHIDQFATAVVDEVCRIEPWTPIEHVYGGAWDVEILGVVRCTDKPVTAMLATPAIIAAEQGGWLDDPGLAPGVRALLDLERELFRSADLIHGISRSIVDTVTDRYGTPSLPPFDHDRVVVHPLGMIDRGAEAGVADLDETQVLEHPTVVFVGRLERRKGIDVFLDAVASVAPHLDGVRFIVAGSDPASGSSLSIAENWRAANADADWIDRIEFLGEIDDQVLHRLYAEATVVVLPSRYESFGLVVLEAMMHGAPIVTSDVGGIAEIATDRTDALLVEAGDAIGLGRAITSLLTDRALRTGLGAAARRTFVEKYTIHDCARQLMIEQSRLLTLPDVATGPLRLDETIDLLPPHGTRCSVTITTLGGAVVSLLADGRRQSHRLRAPGARLHLPMGADRVSVQLLIGDAALVGVTALAGDGS